LHKLGENFANLERGAPLSARSLSNIFQKEFLVKSYGRTPTEFGTKREKFQLKRANIQLEIHKKYYTETNLPFSRGNDE